MNKNTAKFSKVSYCKFKEAWLKTFNNKYNSDLTETELDDIIRKIYDSIQLPKRSSKYSAGHDFYLPCSIMVEPHETVMIPTGINCSMSENLVLMIFPRSGLGTKYQFVLTNLTGIIDSDYIKSDNEGLIFVKMVNNGNKTVELKSGMAFCQGILLKYFTADENEVINERNGGLGSSDNIIEPRH